MWASASARRRTTALSSKPLHPCTCKPPCRPICWRAWAHRKAWPICSSAIRCLALSTAITARFLNGIPRRQLCARAPGFSLQPARQRLPSPFTRARGGPALRRQPAPPAQKRQLDHRVARSRNTQRLAALCLPPQTPPTNRAGEAGV